MSECPHRIDASPENPAFPWCARYRVHLDPQGRLCGRCRDDPAWRERLALQAAARCRVDRRLSGESADGGEVNETPGAPDQDHPFYCGRYDAIADAALCRRCRADPALRAWMDGQAAARRVGAAEGRVTRVRDCAHRGEALREESVVCCGGARRTLVVSRCATHGEAHEARCALCREWEAPRGESAGKAKEQNP